MNTEQQSSKQTDKGAPKPYQILLLTTEHTEWLWLSHLLQETQNLPIDLIWLNNPEQCAQAFNEHCFTAILWDFAFSEGDPQTYLSYLTIESNHTPIICMSADAETALPFPVFQAGAADYLCKRYLSAWSLTKSIHYAHLRHESDKNLNLRNDTDSLTGIVNRNIFFDRLRQSLLASERNQNLIGVAIINIDGFSRINETLGYAAGDHLIRLAATRLQRALRKSDSIARIAGDEFAVILERLEHFYSGSAVAEKLLDLFHTPFALERESVTVSASLGLACYPEQAKTAEDLFKYANRAMLKAKSDHGNSFRFYNQEMNTKLTDNLKLEAEFRHAIRGNQLRLHYQPRIDIANNEIVGMECLVRWEHPERGLLPPAAFIDLAERTGMIVPMGYWVIDQACRDLAKIQELGFSDLNCGVNLSFRQFQDKKLTETLFRIIYNSGVHAADLEFELTESSMMHDLNHTRRCLESMSLIGMAFSLDDFGTGFSSFSTLQQLPISTLKIDKSFVQGIERSEDSRVIVNAIISLAHNLKMNVVAEGVEDEAQLSFLQYHHCDQVQGYYFGKPVPYEDFIKVLRKFYPSNKLSLAKE
jgi:diguanylate cyclase (GGDEF)-like protein